MKIIKLLTPAVIVMMACGITRAGNTKDEGMLTKTHAISTYVDAMTRGKLEGLSDVIDPTAKFTMMQGKHIGSYGKKQMLEFLSKIKGIEEDCTTSTSTFENNTNVTVIKVDMQFSTFTRSNYVTIANTGNGWKIINVYSVFN